MRYLLVLLLLICGYALADDGATDMAGEGGRIRLLDGEHTSISMVRERVQIDLYPGYYDVQAHFTFTNNGKAVTVTMGFPEGGGGDGDGSEDYRAYRRRPGFSQFSSTVDGKKVPVTRVVKVAQDHRYAALWVKKVTFAQGQTREVAVRYRAKPGYSDSIDTYYSNNINYNFTGGNWKGKQERGELELISHIPGVVMLDVTVPDEKRLVKREALSNRVLFAWKDWEAEGDFYASFTTTIPGGYTVAPVPNIARYAWPSWFNDPLLESHDYYLTNPGMPAFVNSLPAVRMYKGVPCIKLRALADFLNMRAAPNGWPKKAALSWEETTATATLQAGKNTFRFTAKDPVMRVNNTA